LDRPNATFKAGSRRARVWTAHPNANLMVADTLKTELNWFIAGTQGKKTRTLSTFPQPPFNLNATFGDLMIEMETALKKGASQFITSSTTRTDSSKTRSDLRSAAPTNVKKDDIKGSEYFSMC
jgi:hypothetical protein